METKLTVVRNNIALKDACALCGCYDRPDVPWCLVDAENHWVCPTCAEKHDPILAEVLDEAIEGHFAKYSEAEARTGCGCQCKS